MLNFTRVKISFANASKRELEDLKYKLIIKDARLDGCTYVVLEDDYIREYGNGPVYVEADKTYDIKEYLKSC